MELPIILIAVFILWTNETLFPKAPKKKSVDEKLAEALKDYIEAGFKIRTEEKK
ncbi:MAG TPA: hypothetical protein VLS96_09915 [Nodosilinea sp.]|nr:hypothetical protein [Nodosilinea sp.]